MGKRGSKYNPWTNVINHQGVCWVCLWYDSLVTAPIITMFAVKGPELDVPPLNQRNKRGGYGSDGAKIALWSPAVG